MFAADCSPLRNPGAGGDVDDGGDGSGSDGGVIAGPKIPGCTGRCEVNRKCGASPTTLTGVVTIPAGTLPLYNAKVYIPIGETLPPLPTAGPSCDRCDAVTDAALVSATTDIMGRFTLENVPTGVNVPLIIRVGKWRRVVTIPSIADCTTLPLEIDQTRLPRNQSEGNIPRIALSTGSADALECMLRGPKLGIDDAEFTTERGSGRIHLYAGATGMNQLRSGDMLTRSQTVPALSWWDDAANFNKYDILMLSCEGDRYMEQKSFAARSNLERFIELGGRVFASHYHNGWIAEGQPPQKIQTVATFPVDAAPDVITATINTAASFEKGRALADWLIQPSVWGPGMPPTRGTFPVQGARNTIGSIVPSLTQSWIHWDNGSYDVEQYFSFNAPIGVPPEKQCGQMVFTDLHVGSGASGDTSQAGSTGAFPNGCRATQLSAQEKALIFMLFDLTNCLAPPIPG